MDEQAVKIRVSGLSKRFTSSRLSVVALDEVDLDVADGEFLCIVGPSGCGKTTLLRIIAGLEQPSGGTVTIVRSDPSKPINSMVFQEQSVFPWMTVRDSIAYGLRLRGVSRPERNRVADHYVELVGLAGFSNLFPHQLSGGMKQRVSVARAFANDPEVLLMDEPFAALDEQNKVLLQGELLKIWEGSRKTVIFITHSIDEAITLGDRVLVVTARPGRVKAEVGVDLPRPRSVYELKGSTEYSRLVGSLWEHLRDEVLRAKEQEVAQREGVVS